MGGVSCDVFKSQYCKETTQKLRTYIQNLERLQTKKSILHSIAFSVLHHLVKYKIEDFAIIHVRVGAYLKNLFSILYVDCRSVKKKFEEF